jgi:hypothetical protein
MADTNILLKRNIKLRGIKYCNEIEALHFEEASSCTVLHTQKQLDLFNEVVCPLQTRTVNTLAQKGQRQ